MKGKESIEMQKCVTGRVCVKKCEGVYVAELDWICNCFEFKYFSTLCWPCLVYWNPWNILKKCKTPCLLVTLGWLNCLPIGHRNVFEYKTIMYFLLLESVWVHQGQVQKKKKKKVQNALPSGNSRLAQLLANRAQKRIWIQNNDVFFAFGECLGASGSGLVGEISRDCDKIIVSALNIRQIVHYSQA